MLALKQSSTSVCTSCRILRPKCSGLILRFFCIALLPSFYRRCLLRIFGIMSFRYCTTALHRGGCKKFVVHGFGGSSVEFEAALTSEEATGKKIQYSERPSATTMTATAKKYVGLRLPLLAGVMMEVRVLPPRTNRRRLTKKRGAGRKFSQLCVV